MVLLDSLAVRSVPPLASSWGALKPTRARACGQVDALRANGALHVEVGRLEVPLGASMDCCHGTGGGGGSGGSSGSRPGGGRRYVRWFPLLLPADAASVVGDQGESLKQDRGEEADDSHFGDFIPCLQVRCQLPCLNAK